jgi:hypothetical protein
MSERRWVRCSDYDPCDDIYRDERDGGDKGNENILRDWELKGAN